MMPTEGAGEAVRASATPPQYGDGQSIRGWQLPLGRTDSLPSGTSGLPLRYFIPDPITEILARCSVAPRPRLPQTDDTAIALLFCRAASRTGDGQVDQSQSRRLCSEVLTPASPPMSVNDLISLGREISPTVTGLRREISFAGGATPSTATKVYAPHTELPRLMDSLAKLTQAVPATDASVLSLLVGYYCVNIHPFVDGNGRWSRVLALRASKKEGLATAAINTAYQNILKAELAATVWPAIHNEGPARYFYQAAKFEQAIWTELEKDLAAKSRSIVATVSERCPSGKARRELLASLYGEERLALEQLRSLMPMSEKAAEALLRKIEQSANGLAAYQNKTLSTKALHSRTDEAIQTAEENHRAN